MPPTGREWLHEVKHDGFRAQAHRRDDAVSIYGKNGGNLNKRQFRGIAAAVAALRCRSAILDLEIVGCDAQGMPSFLELFYGARHGCCAYVFDILELDGRDLRPQSLDARRAALTKLLRSDKTGALRLSKVYRNPGQLLADCAKLGLEGIVSKRRHDPYVSGENRGWIKVKTAEWRIANAKRWELFART